LTDDAIIAAMTDELRRKEEHPMELWLRPITVMQLTGLLQLALRHPEVGDENRATAERFLNGARQFFADCPAVLDVIRRGDDPSQDR